MAATGLRRRRTISIKIYTSVLTRPVPSRTQP